LFINYGDTSILCDESDKGIKKCWGKVELYPDAAKVAKQFQHADKRGIPFAMVGEQRDCWQHVSLKNLECGTSFTRF
jgi:histidyl-tRNA synthetase